MKSALLSSIVVATLLLSGCTSDTTSGGGTTTSEQTVSVQKVSSLQVYDVNNKPIKDANVTIEPVSTTAVQTALVSSRSFNYTIGDDGVLSITGLDNGLYKISISFGGVTVETELEIAQDNYQTSAALVAPVSVEDDGTVSIISNAIIASISGTVTDLNNVPVANAQVGISGGAATNGTFATAVTDENGFYKIIVNVSSALGTLNENNETELNASIVASADGYATKILDSVAIVNKLNKSGFNVKLAPLVDTGTKLYEEDFESETDWTVNKLTGVNDNNTWHRYSVISNAVNTAYTTNLVKLAPNDTSAGELPAPKGGEYCYWYGNNVETDETFGNFIGNKADENVTYNGGKSTAANSAELISPEIDLSTATGDVKLSFDTYWEIESVNPNANGYDIMTIAVSDDNGTSWYNLTRLNPLSDPKTDIDRSAIPFSNTGYNSAPMWIHQEAIPLVDTNGTSLAGKKIRLKFTFNTVDGLYNGFRGWFLDNVTVSEGKGTFPLLQDISNSESVTGFAIEPSAAPAHRLRD